MIVLPNCNSTTTMRAMEFNLASLPDCFTPTRAFAAIDAGTDAIEFFPAEGMNPAVLKVMCAVLPVHVQRLVVGGIMPKNLAQWRSVDTNGFDLGSALYKPG